MTRKKFGALAQLGERNTGSVEVSGSIPLGSTKQQTLVRKCGGFLFVVTPAWRGSFLLLQKLHTRHPWSQFDTSAARSRPTACLLS